MCVRVRAYVCLCVRACVPVCIHICTIHIHACIHTYNMCGYTQAATCMYMYDVSITLKSTTTEVIPVRDNTVSARRSDTLSSGPAAVV